MPDVKKVELVGVQPEKIFVQMQTAKLAQLGLDINSIASTIKAQTSINASGMIEADTANSYLRITGSPDSVEILLPSPSMPTAVSSAWAISQPSPAVMQTRRKQ